MSNTITLSSVTSGGSSSLGTFLVYFAADARQYNAAVKDLGATTDNAMGDMARTVDRTAKEAAQSVQRAVQETAQVVKTTSADVNTTIRSMANSDAAARKQMIDQSIADLKRRSASAVNDTKRDWDAVLDTQRKATAGMGYDYTAYLEKRAARELAALDTSKQTATKQVQITQNAANQNVGIWQKMVREFKIASLPAQADWNELFGKMEGRQSQFALNTRNLFKGIIAGFGFAAAYQIIEKAIEAVINKIGEAQRVHDELLKSSKALDVSYRELAKTMRDSFINMKDLPTQVFLREQDLAKAKQGVKDIGTELNQITKDRQEAEKVMGFTPFPTFDAKTAKMVSDMSLRQARMTEKYGLPAGAAPSTLFDKITEKENEALERQKKAYEGIKAATDALAQAKINLATATGDDLPKEAGEAAILQERYKKLGVEIQNYAKNILLPQLKAEHENRDAKSETNAQLTELARKYVLASDSGAKFQKQVDEINFLFARQKLTATEAALAIDQVQRARDAEMNGRKSPRGDFDLAGIDKMMRDAQMGATLPGNEEYGRIEQEKKMLQDLYKANVAYFESNLKAREAYNARTAQLEMARNMLMLAQAEGVFGQLAGIAEDAFGKQSGAYKIMFATQKAFAIAQATLAMQQAIAQASTLPWPANIPAILAAASQGASIISNMQAIALSFEGGGYTGDGARRGGLDGKGGFMAMLHPQESVIDHTQTNASGMQQKDTVQVSIQQVFTGGVTQADLVRSAEITKRQTMEAVADAISRGGAFRKAVQQ